MNNFSEFEQYAEELVKPQVEAFQIEGITIDFKESRTKSRKIPSPIEGAVSRLIIEKTGA